MMNSSYATPSGSFTAPTSPTVSNPMFRTNTLGASASAASVTASSLDRSASAHPDLNSVNGLGISAEESSVNGTTNGTSSSGGTKETWKRRKQLLLAEAKDHTVADLQLHGLRPPPHSYHPYYQNSSILGQTVGQLTAHTASTSRDTNPNQATYASSRTAILRPDDPHVRNDIIRMIDQWLADEGFGATRQLLMEEAGSSGESGKRRGWTHASCVDIFWRETGPRWISCCRSRWSRTTRRSSTPCTSSSSWSISSTGSSKKDLLSSTRG